MIEVVGWVPVVEDFIAVLDGGEASGDEIGKGEDAEGREDAELWWLLRWSTAWRLASCSRGIAIQHVLRAAYSPVRRIRRF
jgi:hypothetical protein